MRRIIICIACFFGLTAAAQDLVFSTQAVDQCLLTGQTEACIGLSAEACQTNSPGGGSTVGIVGCISQETGYWDGALNYYYQDLLRRDPDRAEQLREVQRAWITFRDATCGYEADEFPGGTIMGVIAADCAMRMTGRQTLYLREIHSQLSQ